jgi:hypothetical protein
VSPVISTQSLLLSVTDTLAGALIMLSIAGFLLWSKLRGTCRTAWVGGTCWSVAEWVSLQKWFFATRLVNPNERREQGLILV